MMGIIVNNSDALKSSWRFGHTQAVSEGSH